MPGNADPMRRRAQKSDGVFTYRVPVGAKKAQIELWGDSGLGTFAIYCYGAC